jgi:hypothetical protein
MAETQTKGAQENMGKRRGRKDMDPVWPKELVAHLKNQGVSEEETARMNPETVLEMAQSLDEKHVPKVLQCLIKTSRTPATLKSRISIIVTHKDKSADDLLWIYNFMRMVHGMERYSTKKKESSKNSRGFLKNLLETYKDREHTLLRMAIVFILRHIELSEEVLEEVIKEEMADTEMVKDDPECSEEDQMIGKHFLAFSGEGKKLKKIMGERMGVKMSMLQELLEKSKEVRAFPEFVDMCRSFNRSPVDRQRFRVMGSIVLKKYTGSEEIVKISRMYISAMKKRFFEPGFIRFFVNRTKDVNEAERREYLRGVLEYVLTETGIKESNVREMDISLLDLGLFLEAISSLDKRKANPSTLVSVVKGLVSRNKKHPGLSDLHRLLEGIGGRSVRDMRTHIAALLKNVSCDENTPDLETA